ncbi:hypothetical protein OU787_16500 [Kitasatospora sp. YST-16]|uniref:hypothetical protein n=1 Tax=Kitasatospora sp. YST-16 TaxID=2998080 RepID=UPI002283985A|nr:hypothetical protein [Kitasatospora sp. YST-16]WAL72963.1 hypothetical protein OU787_16500 [Kitasatospora sp. YST-16]WNW39012.1 hypothetical protein RKE32_16455 [Streptomyces sp. Li-HN-5-13]
MEVRHRPVRVRRHRGQGGPHQHQVLGPRRLRHRPGRPGRLQRGRRLDGRRHPQARLHRSSGPTRFSAGAGACRNSGADGAGAAVAGTVGAQVGFAGTAGTGTSPAAPTGTTGATGPTGNGSADGETAGNTAAAGGCSAGPDGSRCSGAVGAVGSPSFDDRLPRTS